jgi:hypothetical protein
MLPTETPPDRRRKFTVIAGGKKLNYSEASSLSAKSEAFRVAMTFVSRAA